MAAVPSGLRRVSPWSAIEAARWIVLALAGHVAFGVGFWQVSREADFDQQVGPASLAVGGLIVAGFAHVSWLLRGRAQIHALELELLHAPQSVVPAGAATSDDLAGVVVTSPDSRLFHRPTCPLAADRAWAKGPISRQVALERDGRPCGVCTP